MTKDLVTIYPVSGFYLDGVPAIPTTTDAGTAAAYIVSGAFTYAAPGGAPPLPESEPAPAEPAPEEA